MSFNGTFLSCWNESTSEYDEFPTEYMYKESYNGAKEVQDINSTRLANGVLDRNVLDHTASTIKFSTPPMWNTDMNKVFKNYFNAHYLTDHVTERKLKCKYYVNETDSYEEGEFYMSTPTFTVNRVSGKKIFYNSVEINLIQY